MDDGPDVAGEAVPVDFTGMSRGAHGLLDGALADALSAIDAGLKIDLDRRCEMQNGGGCCASLPATQPVPFNLAGRATVRFYPRGAFGGGNAKPDEEILTVISSAGGGYEPAGEAELARTEKDPRLGVGSGVATRASRIWRTR